MSFFGGVVFFLFFVLASVFEQKFTKYSEKVWKCLLIHSIYPIPAVGWFWILQRDSLRRDARNILWECSVRIPRNGTL